MIAPDSASYPIMGAADAVGLDAGLAYRWFWARKAWVEGGYSQADGERCWALDGELRAAIGAVGRQLFQDAIWAAYEAGRIHAPWVKGGPHA